MGKGPDFANSSRLHAAPFQRQPVNDSTGPRFHASRAVAWRRRVHSVTPSQIAEDRQPRRRECVSFRQVPSASRPRIRALPKLPHSRQPKNQSNLCRSGRAAGQTPARHPLAHGAGLSAPPPPTLPIAPRCPGKHRCQSRTIREGLRQVPFVSGKPIQVLS